MPDFQLCSFILIGFLEFKIKYCDVNIFEFSLLVPLCVWIGCNWQNPFKNSSFSLARNYHEMYLGNHLFVGNIGDI